jgi:hypothetical protein
MLLIFKKSDSKYAKIATMLSPRSEVDNEEGRSSLLPAQAMTTD